MEDCHQLAVLLPPSLDSFGGKSDPVLHRLGVARVIVLEGGLSKRLQLLICKMEGKWGLGQGHELRGELAVCSGLPAQNCCSNKVKHPFLVASSSKKRNDKCFRTAMPVGSGPWTSGTNSSGSPTMSTTFIPQS